MKRVSVFVIFSVLFFSLYAETKNNNNDNLLNKERVDTYFNENDIRNSNKNICRLYINTNISNYPMILRIEDSKVSGSLVVKGVEKRKLNYFYKYMQDGVYSISKKGSQTFFNDVIESGFFDKNKVNQKVNSFKRLNTSYLLECRVKGFYRQEVFHETINQNVLLNLSHKIQKIAAQTIPVGSYRVEQEVKNDYAKIMKSLKKPFCSKENDKGIAILVANRRSGNSSQYGVLSLIEFYKNKDGVAALIYRSVYENNGIWSAPFFDAEINKKRVQKVLKTIKERISKEKRIIPDFIWRRKTGDVFVSIWENNICDVVYDVRRCKHCPIGLITNFWIDIGKEVEDVFKKTTGTTKIKIFKENPDK